MRLLRLLAAAAVLSRMNAAAAAQSENRVALDRLELQAGMALGGGTPVYDQYAWWGGGALGLVCQFAIGAHQRLGVAGVYQYNSYSPGSSDVDRYYFDHPPTAHVPQLTLYWGYAFTQPSGTEHGPRLGVGALVAFDGDPSRAGPNRVRYPGVFAQAGYHAAWAVPTTHWSIMADWSFILGQNFIRRHDADWSLQLRIMGGAVLRFQ